MDVTGNVKVTLGTNRDLSADLQAGTVAISQAIQAVFANGADDNEIDLVFADTATLITEAVQSYNLDELTDPVTGAAIAFDKVRAIIIYSKLTTNKVITLGGVSNAFQGPFGNAADTLEIPPEGFVVLTAPIDGWGVVAATGDILALTNAAGGSSTFDIYILGSGAA